MGYIASLLSGLPAGSLFNAVGIVVLLVGAVLGYFGERIAGEQKRLIVPLRLAGLILAVLGALITMKIF